MFFSRVLLSKRSLKMKQTRRKFDKVEPNTAEITLVSLSCNVYRDTLACENNAALNGIKLNFPPSNIDKYIYYKSISIEEKKEFVYFFSPISTMMLSQIVCVRMFRDRPTNLIEH